MEKRKRCCLAVAVLSFSLLWAQGAFGGPMRVTENLREEAVLIPSSAPERRQLILKTFVTITSKTEVIGRLAIYNDPTTRRPVDYLELYDRTGSFLLAEWVDKFGIHRMAIDRGIVERTVPVVQGVLVLLPRGTPL